MCNILLNQSADQLRPLRVAFCRGSRIKKRVKKKGPTMLLRGAVF